MITMILEVTDANEIVALTPHNGEVWEKKCSQDEADFYRKRLAQEIMFRTYFDEIPGKIIGRYIRLDPFNNNSETNKEFYFKPA